MAAQLLLTLLLSSLTRKAQSSPESYTDSFVSSCSFVEPTTDIDSSSARKLSNPVLLWSSSATWPSRIVPGVGAAKGVNATIPCGQTIILDVPNVELGVLRIRGLLNFLDDPSLPLIHVKANFVLVEGQLVIGRPDAQFRQMARIELTPNTGNKRASFKYTFTPPAEPAYPRDFGHKAFVVVGGQVKLHGLPASKSMPIWARLSLSASNADIRIQIDKDVSGLWPVGGHIVVASSDYSRVQTETFRIVKVTSLGNGHSTITLNSPLVYKHYGNVAGYRDEFGGFIDQRAEVALVSRNIVITGTDEPAPHHLEGGHFMIFMTKNPPQYIEGVEFHKMGQQGILGRYPLHLHILGSVPSTLIRKNSITQSKQRCVVLHATHNITVDSNVSFNTTGHCFMVEEGGEMDNTFVDNLGILTVIPQVIISGAESDNRPSIFWISNPNNKYIRNTAVGSADSGFWFQLQFTVRGNSLYIPSLKAITPYYIPIDAFVNNTAHSNDFGLRTYPSGMAPRFESLSPGSTNVIDRLITYKNKHAGMFFLKTDSLNVTNSVFADNNIGLRMSSVNGISVQNSRFILYTNNYGNPSKCYDPADKATCIPIDRTDCRFPLKPGVPLRSSGGRNRTEVRYGITLDQSRTNRALPCSFVNITFSEYNYSCFANAAFAFLQSSLFWNPGHTSRGLRFSPGTQRLLTDTPPPSSVEIVEQSLFYTMRDTDGSLIGGPGYVVANTTQILPPGLQGCTPQPKWNAYGCLGVCYRGIYLTYPEPNFVGLPSSTRSSFSYLKVTRADGQVLLLDGNMRSSNEPIRMYFMTLLANQEYQIEVVPPGRNPGFRPVNITFQFSEIGGCEQGLTLQFRQMADTPWTLPSTETIYLQKCVAVNRFPSTFPNVQYRYVCINQQPWISFHLSHSLTIPISIFPGPSVDNKVCSGISPCSLLWSRQRWLYDESGLERRPAFYNPILSQPGNWRNSSAPFGWRIREDSQIATVVRKPNATLLTYYFRTTFTVAYASYYSSLLLDLTAGDGAVVYLNNIEILRFNLPDGPITNKTVASSRKKFMFTKTFIIPIKGFQLYNGVNTVAVEYHAFAQTDYEVSFDLRLSAVLTRTSYPRNTTEICDGIDNDGDGSVDMDPSMKPLTAPCRTACSSGRLTCINGLFAKCTAVPPSPEVCDGVDNNCDGLVDNGISVLDCPSGKVCWRGKCQTLRNATVPVKVWPRNSTGWSFYDKGGNLDSLNPKWKNGSKTATWRTGTAPIGFDNSNPRTKGQWIATRAANFAADRLSLTIYFLKTFTMTSLDLAATFNLDFSLRRVDGGVVYLNGKEIWRDNMKSGPVIFSTASRSRICCNASLTFYHCITCTRANHALLKVGTNVVAAEVHINTWRNQMAAFDMDLYRNVYQTCASCVRQVAVTIIPEKAVWKYLDGSKPHPSSDWKLPGYDDGSWASGVAPLGYGSSPIVLNTELKSGPLTGSNPRLTYYFRTKLNLPDATCYFSLRGSLMGQIGAVVYINGLEAVRVNMPPGQIDSSTSASKSGSLDHVSATPITGGWFRSSGMNVIAVEAHRYFFISRFIFDLLIIGLREAVTCVPDPSTSSIPWEN